MAIKMGQHRGGWVTLMELGAGNKCVSGGRSGMEPCQYLALNGQWEWPGKRNDQETVRADRQL